MTEVQHGGAASSAPAPTESSRGPADVLWSTATCQGQTFLRAAARTPWLTEADDLADVLHVTIGSLLQPTDTVLVTEKIAVLLTGRAVDATGIKPGLLARRLARHIRPVGDSCGLSLPEKMQYVVQSAGRPRVLAAAGLAAITRLAGRHGTFYRLAGSVARDLDGLRPPYFGVLLPPLTRAQARRLADQLEHEFGAGVAIVDINDRGGSIRATSRLAIAPRTLLAVLADNPLGQRTQSTPVGLVRPAGPASPASPASPADSASAVHPSRERNRHQPG